MAKTKVPASTAKTEDGKAAPKGRRTLQITRSGRPFSKFVEVGRVAYIAHGKHKGKLCAIVDVIDQNRALIDGPCTGVTRQAYLLKRLHLTRFRIRFPHTSKSKVIRKLWESNDINGKWNNTKWAKRIEKRKIRSQLTDFERFKLTKLKQVRNRIVLREFFRLRKKYRTGINDRVKANHEKQKVVKEEARQKRKTLKKEGKSTAAPAAKKGAPAAKAAPATKKPAGKPAAGKGKPAPAKGKGGK